MKKAGDYIRNLFINLAINLKETISSIIIRLGGGAGGGGGEVIKEPFDVILDVHYYREGNEINYFYLSNFTYDAISIDVIGTNNKDYNLTNVHILMISPPQFSDSIERKQEILSSNETKMLWNSSIMKISDFEDENVTFYIKVLAYGKEVLYGEDSFSLIIGEYLEEDEPLFFTLGEKIYPTNPLVGAILGLLGISVGIFFLWRYDNVFVFIEKKAKDWKIKGITKTKKNKQEQEGW